MTYEGRPVPDVPFREARRAWWHIALHSFGGPAGQIAVIHRVVVDEKRWIDEPQFLRALSYCMLLPGPEAQQLATYLGWRLHGLKGGLTAGLLFVLPGFVTILALSMLYWSARDLAVVEAVFHGLKPAVLVIVIAAVFRLARRTGDLRGRWWIASGAFVALFAFQAPFPLVLLAAAIAGTAMGAESTAPATGPAPPLSTLARTVATWLVIWMTPVVVLLVTLGPSHVLSREAVFFSQAAVVTFGGAYAVLSYVAQQAVETFAWLTPVEMLDGLGMAETTPGPLIMVVQFVGFMGAARELTTLPPLVAGSVGAVVTTWVTFAPCFLFIFAGAPYVERLTSQPRLRAALAGVTAAVLGVILNLAVWFGQHTMFAGARWREPDIGAIAIFGLTALLAWRVRPSMVVLLGVGAAAGLALGLLRY